MTNHKPLQTEQKTDDSVHMEGVGGAIRSRVRGQPGRSGDLVHFLTIARGY